MRNRYVARKLGYRTGDGLHGVSGVKWGIYDTVEKKIVDDENPSESRDEARHRAGWMSRQFAADRARERSAELIDDVVEQIVAATPAGWTSTVGVGSKLFGEDYAEEGTKKRFVEFVHEDGHAVVVLNVAPVETYTRPWDGVSVEGDVLVDGGSFVRRGIDVACCWLRNEAPGEPNVSHEYSTVESLLAGEKARVDACLERRKTAVAIPGLPFTRQPDWIEKAKADLRAGRSVTLTPHGFGTGYTIHGAYSRYDQRAKPETEAFFGVGRLYVSQIDCD